MVKLDGYRICDNNVSDLRASCSLRSPAGLGGEQAPVPGMCSASSQIEARREDMFMNTVRF